MTGKKLILISTRPSVKDSGFREAGCLEIINIPVTETITYPYSSSLKEDIVEFQPSALVFTSSFGVMQFHLLYPDVLETFHGSIFAIGNKTAEAIGKTGFTAMVPERKDSRGLASLIINNTKGTGNIALIRSRNADSILFDSLNKAGFKVRDYAIYEVSESTDARKITAAIKEPGVSGIILTSPMEASIVAKLTGPELRLVPIYAIGLTTRTKLNDLGFTVCGPLGESHFEDLVRKISDNLCR